MKRIITIPFLLFLVIITINANARCDDFAMRVFPSTESITSKCDYYAMKVFPSTESITSNTLIVVEFYSYSSLFLSKCKHNFQLRSGEDIVSLEPVRILVGSSLNKQLELKVQGKLKLNKVYTIEVSNVPKYIQDELNRYNRKSKKHEDVSWIATEIEKNDVEEGFEIIHGSNPEITNHFGLGPIVNSIFLEKSRMSSITLYYYTELKEIDTNKIFSFYTESIDNKILIGSSACGGSYEFNPDYEYEIKFKTMNINGVDGPETNWVEFKNPLGKQ